MPPSTHSNDRYDAVVIGARLAGAATSMLLARRGLRVLAVDRGAYGSDALSTHALMRAGVQQLARWGLLSRVRESGTPAIRSTAFHYGDECIEILIKPRDDIDALYAPRRQVLDRLLVDSAREAGAEVRYGTRLTGLTRDESGRVNGVRLEEHDGSVREVQCGIVIGADGMHSRVAQLTNARVERESRHATAFVYGYYAGLPLEGYHWYYGHEVSAGTVPSNGVTCVFVAVRPERYLREVHGDVEGWFTRTLAEAAPGLMPLIAGATRVESLRRFQGQRGTMRTCAGPGWALVGDAGYFKDPSTSHGMSDALRDAELLARAVTEGSDQALTQYQETRDALSRGFFEVTDEIASFDWDLPALQRLHKRLSEETVNEVQLLASLPPDARKAA